MGIAGRIARAFVTSRLTPLVTGASLLVGLLALLATPREEEPQISVPMIDVFLSLPGAPPDEVEQLLIRPVERRMAELPAVDHVYAMAGDGMGLVTVRFAVGADQERSVVLVHVKLQSMAGVLPPDAPPPLVQPHSIDDVPILALTLHAKHYGSDALRQLAVHLEDAIRALPDVAQTMVIGGRARQFSVLLDPVRLAARSVGPEEVLGALHTAGIQRQAGAVFTGHGEEPLRVEAPLDAVDAVEQVVVAVRNGSPVRVRDVATVEDDFGEPTAYVTHQAPHDGDGGVRQAVTIAVAKRKGANATRVADAVLERVDAVRGRLVPSDVSVSVTRNYGETAEEKAQELMLHLALATVSVTVLVGLVLGWREGAVVLVAVPVTLALTLFIYYLFGYTLNRITLFALIFSIGILVDDAIVVVENIYRHWRLRPDQPEAAAIRGVDEVGNPTILATFTVIAAILPMAFVTGLMGPYMRPIPVGASAAMLISLGVALTVTPYLALRLLRRQGGNGAPHAAAGMSPHGGGVGRWRAGYERWMNGLLDHPRRRWIFYAGTAGALALSGLLVATGVVAVKMLPFDNKSEFQVILDFPEGTTLEANAAASGEVARYLGTIPEVASLETYAGTAAPFNFNGLVRHYFLRQGPTTADIQVMLVPKGERARQSHAIAMAVRDSVAVIAGRSGARAKIAEIPPGPPVLSTLVAEVYAGDDSTRLAAARKVRKVFERTPGVVDVDWSIEEPIGQVRLHLDWARMAEVGVQAAPVADLVALAASGRGGSVARAASLAAREPIPIVPRLPLVDRAAVEDLLRLPIGTAGGPVPLARFVTVDTGVRPTARYRRDQRPVIYVTGDVAGRLASPVYAIGAMNRALDTLAAAGASIERYNMVQPERLDAVALKWDGEWQITLEVFRDLGLAFAVVLVLIYLLVVGWFQSYTIPLVIMAPIPLTLIGILPGHAVAGAFFTATSMIGMIALAGIIVRNSILLVDFARLAEAQGRSAREAVLAAGAVRFRPIALTAAAVVIGGAVMVLDPIFQGLAVALMSGAIVATGLTMVVVPLLYWEVRRRAPASRALEVSHV